jgi:hypothetical protein
MIKIIGTGIWICVVTLAAVYFSMQSTTTTSAAPPPGEYFGGLDYVRGDVISVPVFNKGAVHGYFLARLVFTAERPKLATLSIDPQALITDALYTHLIGHETINFAEMDTFDLESFRTSIRDALNARIGERVFHEIIVEQVDYLTKDEVRANQRG